MKRSNRLVLLVGVFLAVIAFVGVIVLSGGGGGGEPTDEGPPKELPTVVAIADIPLGTEIRADQVETRVIAVEGRDADAFADVSQVIGQIARQEVKTGAAVTGRTLSGGVSGRIVDLDVQPGYRAMAVEVDQVTGVGTLIKPGDYVDMVIRYRIKGADIDPETGEVIISEEEELDPTTSKLILQGMQVIGTLLPPAQPAAGAGTGEGQTAATPAPGTAFTEGHELVILSLTPAQVEVVKWVQNPNVNPAWGINEPSISLVLRSPADFVDAEGNPLIADTPCTTVRPAPTPAPAESPAPGASATPVPAFPCEVTPGVVLADLIEDYGVLIPRSVNPLFIGVGADFPTPTPNP